MAVIRRQAKQPLTRHLHPAGEPYATQSGKARVTAAVRLDTCSLV